MEWLFLPLARPGSGTGSGHPVAPWIRSGQRPLAQDGSTTGKGRLAGVQPRPVGLWSFRPADDSSGQPRLGTAGERLYRAGGAEACRPAGQFPGGPDGPDSRRTPTETDPRCGGRTAAGPSPDPTDPITTITLATLLATAPSGIGSEAAAPGAAGAPDRPHRSAQIRPPGRLPPIDRFRPGAAAADCPTSAPPDRGPSASGDEPGHGPATAGGNGPGPAAATEISAAVDLGTAGSFCAPERDPEDPCLPT